LLQLVGREIKKRWTRIGVIIDCKLELIRGEWSLLDEPV
jgi:hypothetical protein